MTTFQFAYLWSRAHVCCSRDKDHVELSHGNHGCSNVSHEVITVDSVANVEATISDANEVNIGIVFILLTQVLLDPVLDRHVGLIL